MNPSQSASSADQTYTVGAPLIGRNHDSIQLGNGVDEQLDTLQMSPYGSAQQNVGPGGMLSNGNMQAMLDPPLMMSMNLGAGNGMTLHPQLCSGGDQFTTLAATAPMGIPGDYGNMGGSILTEFTKRRNWSQRILEELQDLLHIITPTGKIVYASQSCKTLTGFEPEELIGKFITEFIHEDDSALFVRDFNESIATGRPLRLFYRFRKFDDTYCIFETHGHPHISDAPQVDPSSLQSVCKGFFMMARPYPTRNAALLDSFLEHKIENERLMKRITELRQEENEDQQQQRQRQQAHTDNGLQSVSQGSFSGNDTPMSTSHTPSSTDSMPPPAKPLSALTRQNLDRMEASSAARSEGIRDKMARYDGTTHMDTIEILTGLRYREGERSKGISTGDTSPALIRGDVGVPIPLDKENRQTSDKKKKQKVADEYVCTDCGTLESPEWRKGPKGPKTLCNACGLRWAKFVLLS
ncbi:hypothetical protein EDC01DRAFT_662132 [Geopyxis carbonaria]|nr:hypothetical protein EDC01DRAFT_662132 [Geopyxis carbonaria]